jgi:hypothetical protein
MRNQLVGRIESGKVTHSGRSCADLTRPLGDQAHARLAQSESYQRIAEAVARPDFATSDGILRSAILSAL